MTKSKSIPRTVNVTRLFREVSVTELQEGLDWYEVAHQQASEMALRTNWTVDKAAGVLAAVSPKNPWERNVVLAEKILASNDTSSGYLGHGLRSSRRILDGEDPLAVLGGQKTRNFYRSIISRGMDGVCIDRHAWDIVTNTRHTEAGRPAITKGRYAAAEHAYRRASVILTSEGYLVSPAQVQAVTWVHWRNKHGIQVS